MSKMAFDDPAVRFEVETLPSNIKEVKNPADPINSDGNVRLFTC